MNRNHLEINGHQSQNMTNTLSITWKRSCPMYNSKLRLIFTLNVTKENFLIFLLSPFFIFQLNLEAHKPYYVSVFPEINTDEDNPFTISKGVVSYSVTVSGTLYRWLNTAHKPCTFECNQIVFQDWKSCRKYRNH